MVLVVMPRAWVALAKDKRWCVRHCAKKAGVLVRRVLRLRIQPQTVGANLNVLLRPHQGPAFTFHQSCLCKHVRIFQEFKTFRFSQQRRKINRVSAAINKLKPQAVV